MDTVIPRLDPDSDESTISVAGEGPPSSQRRPHLVRLTGHGAGSASLIDASSIIGRGDDAEVRVDDSGVSRKHARLYRTDSGEFWVEDLGSSNGTRVNGEALGAATRLAEGDKVSVGNTTFRFTLLDSVDERYHEMVTQSRIPAGILPVIEPVDDPLASWRVDSWRGRTSTQAVEYDDPIELEGVLKRLRRLPPLVTSWEVDDLRRDLALAEDGHRFLLQGGDCAETHDDCESQIITNKLKILLQMSLVLIRGAGRPVIRVGRFAGQYGKPRSKPTESRNGVELPSYFGDLVNRPEFTAAARRPDPNRLLESYYHAALTLNFVRSVSGAAFPDLRRPEYFDLSYFERAELPPSLKHDYRRMCQELTEHIRFMRAAGGESSVDELMQVKFYASHEGLNLHYEAAQTRTVPRSAHHYDLSTHMPWIGERTRGLQGPHVEFFRGVRNPIGIKVGPTSDPHEIVELTRRLNPANEAGKLVLITRLGAKNVERALPPLIDAVRRANRRGLWISDPMHGNGITTSTNLKTRNFDDILAEVTSVMGVHESLGSYCGGVHFELTGEDVTECLGGGLEEADLSRNYMTACDPRLNYRQAIQMAFSVADGLQRSRRPVSIPPPR